MIVFKILVYLGTIPFIIFWLWIEISALLGKETFLAKKDKSRRSVVLLSAVLIIENSLFLVSTTPIDALAIMLMDKWQEMQYFWADSIVQITRLNQP